MPAYVQRGGEQDYANPFQLTNVAINSWVLNSDYAALSILIDREINSVLEQAPRKFWQPKIRVHPIVPYSLLVCAQAAQIHTQPQGYVPEVDVAFWVPVIIVDWYGALPIPRAVGFYQPYLFVDSSVAMATGRETYGYNKMIGNFTLPINPDNPTELTVDTLGFAQYGPNQKGEMRRLLRCHQASNTGGGTVWHTIEEAAEALFDILADGVIDVAVPAINRTIKLLDMFGVDEVQQVFLKQFRSIRNPAEACYQAIEMAPAYPRSFHAGGLVAGEYELDIEALVSHPVRSDLGLDPGTIKAKAAMWAEIDFDLRTGEVLGRSI